MDPCDNITRLSDVVDLSGVCNFLPSWTVDIRHSTRFSHQCFLEPQPVIHDPVLNITFPYNLTNPDTIPEEDADLGLFPLPDAKLSDCEKQALIEEVVANVTKIKLFKQAFEIA